MNKRQRRILREFFIVIAITVFAVFLMINFKDLVNRSEAIRAMKTLSKRISEYRKARNSLPHESWIEAQKETLPGAPRLGDIKYRALWINTDSPDDEILAYSNRNYHSLFVGKGYVVLRLNGHVEWMGKKEFEQLLKKQQSKAESQFLQNQLTEKPGEF